MNESVCACIGIMRVNVQCVRGFSTHLYSTLHLHFSLIGEKTFLLSQ